MDLLTGELCYDQIVPSEAKQLEQDILDLISHNKIEIDTSKAEVDTSTVEIDTSSIKIESLEK